MQFRTQVKIPQYPFSIPPCAKMLFVGSCFAQSMGERFLAEKFRATVNPYGVMYNPASILHTVSRCQSSADFAVLTLGTNHVYRLKETDEIVDNCQKRPQSLFREEVLSIDECVGFLSQAVDSLVKRNPDIKVIVTVSPIRYAKYGFHESQLSKAVLLLSANEMEKRYAGKVFYFPAYEIVNDELRDYRFYASECFIRLNRPLSIYGRVSLFLYSVPTPFSSLKSGSRSVRQSIIAPSIRILMRIRNSLIIRS